VDEIHEIMIENHLESNEMAVDPTHHRCPSTALDSSRGFTIDGVELIAAGVIEVELGELP
jgi:hypothetical protein